MEERHPAGFAFRGMDNRVGDVFLRRKVDSSGAVRDGDVRSHGAKRPRMAPDSEAETSGPSCSPRCAAAAGGASVGSTDEYEETCRLGKGGFGTVVKARHRATGRTVAIKRLGPSDDDEGADPEEELLREARFLEACAGVPFVVGFHGVVRDPATGDLRLVMECVGPSIDDFLLRRRYHHHGAAPPLPEPTLRAVMWQLLTAAAGMHARGVVHRDIKPENVLVADDLRAVKLCDFGLAMCASDPPPHDPVGTEGYTAPEILLEMPAYDVRVDVWSIGCVMAEIVTGESLFDTRGDHPDEELLAIVRVLGVPDEEAWPGFLSTPFASEWMPELDLQQPNVLRDLIPETMLSDQGFEVLSGLLVCNPDRRLTAAAALKHPWFAEEDALEMQPKVLSALPKEELLIDSADSPDRRKLLCV